jgi:nucleotide-binding universal stress UspA family protein
MKRILFPTDFSDSASNALMYAGQYVKENNSELVLYNAYGVLEPQYLEDRVDRLQDLAKDVSNSYKINCRAIAEPTFGDLSKHINHIAESYDLIIMGTKGTDSFLQFLMGSNAYNTILKADVPFLIIPLGFKGTTITNVVYAYDYSKEQRLPVQQLLPFLESLDNKSLTVLRVIEKDIDSNLKIVTETSAAPLHNIDDGLELKFESLYSSTKIADTIHQYVAKRNTTALCLCTQRRRFFEHVFHKSVIKEISAIANYPLFVFHN